MATAGTEAEPPEPLQQPNNSYATATADAEYTASLTNNISHRPAIATAAIEAFEGLQPEQHPQPTNRYTNMTHEEYTACQQAAKKLFYPSPSLSPKPPGSPLRLASCSRTKLGLFCTNKPLREQYPSSVPGPPPRLASYDQIKSGLSPRPSSSNPLGPYILNLPPETTYIPPIPAMPGNRYPDTCIPIATTTCQCKIHTIARKISVVVAYNKSLFPTEYNNFQTIRAQYELDQISLWTAIRRIRIEYLLPLGIDPLIRIDWDLDYLEKSSSKKQAKDVGILLEFFKEEALANRYTMGEMRLTRWRDWARRQAAPLGGLRKCADYEKFLEMHAVEKREVEKEVFMAYI